MTPPPGWYRDPRPRTRSAGGTERPGPSTGARPSPRDRRCRPAGAPCVDAGAAVRGRCTGRRAKAVALTAAGAVLVTAIVTGAIVLGTDDDGAEVNTAPTLAASERTARPPTAPRAADPHPAGSTSEPSADDPAVVEDQLNGITLPLLDGWVRPAARRRGRRPHDHGRHLRMPRRRRLLPTRQGHLPHGDSGRRDLPRGPRQGRTSRTRPTTPTTATPSAGDPFGGIESHQVVKSGPVAVAGRAGYLVRWRVRTAEGPGGYVQSLAFPSTVGTEAPVIVRYVFDAGEDGPPLADMDRFTKGIRSIGDADTGRRGQQHRPDG